MTRRYCNDCERPRETKRLTKPAWIGITIAIIWGLNQFVNADPIVLWLWLGLCIGVPYALMKDQCTFCGSTDTQKGKPHFEKR